MTALVSILIPTDNAEDWVGAAIDSALGQFGAEEIIVVDDGSTDGALAGARQFESNEVRAVMQPNQRAAAARVPSAGDTANPDEWKHDLEKYEHLEELPELFFAAKRRRLQAPHPAALNTHSFGLPAIATDVAPSETISWRRRRSFFAGQRVRRI